MFMRYSEFAVKNLSYLLNTTKIEIYFSLFVFAHKEEKTIIGKNVTDTFKRN